MLMRVLSDPGRHPAEVHSNPGLGSRLVAMPPAGLVPVVATSGLFPGIGKGYLTQEGTNTGS